MDPLRLLLLIACVVAAADEAFGHPKSWLTTTKRPTPGSKNKKKPKRSVTEVDVTYYPGLTAEYKDAIRFEELRKFLREEENDAEGEEEVIVRLMREEEESATEEPIEFAVQKRVMMQLKKPESQIREMFDFSEFSEEEEEFLSRLKNPNHNLDEEFFGYTLAEAEPQDATPVDLTPDHPVIDAVPEETVRRLLLGELTPPVYRGGSESSQRFTEPLSTSPLHETNSYRHRHHYDHESRQKYLLGELLNNQRQIDMRDLEFLTDSYNDEESEIASSSDRPHVEEQQNYDDISEAQLDWEEYHEYDA